MDYEQRYKEALDEAKAIHKAIKQDLKPVIEQIFPELKESDDDRIRKELIKLLRNLFNNYSYFIKDPFYTECINWLKKQGEINIQNNNSLKIEPDKFYFCIKDYFAGGCYRSKKGDIVLAKNGMNMMGLSPKKASEYFMPINPFKEHVVVDWFEKEREKPQGKSALDAINEEEVDNANKVEPKFNLYDWVVTDKGDVVQIGAINNGYYTLYNGMDFNMSYVDKCWHLWTDQDIKDGDVLCTYEYGKPKIIFILKGTPKKPYVLRYYCYYNIMYPYFEPDAETGCLVVNDGDLKPATKEQCETLFEKMKLEGYKWDEDEKKIIRFERREESDFAFKEDENGVIKFVHKKSKV